MIGRSGHPASQRHARIAGFLFLFYIIAALSSQILVGSFVVSGSFAVKRQPFE